MEQGFFSLKFLNIHLYGLFISLGLVFLYWYTRKHSLDFSIRKDKLDISFVFVILLSLVGARLYHVLSWYSYYKLFPLEALYIWQGGLGIFGAVIGGIFALFLSSRLSKISFFNLLSLFAPPALLAQAVGRMGNFFNKEAFGPPTNLPWGVFIPLNNRPVQFLGKQMFHPTFFYEGFLCLLAFLIFLFLKNKKRLKKEFFLSYYLISYGLIRVFTESLRFDTWVVFGVKFAYIFSFFFIAIGFVLIFLKKAKNRN